MWDRRWETGTRMFSHSVSSSSSLSFPSPRLSLWSCQNPGPPTWQHSKILCTCPKLHFCSRLVSFHSIQRSMHEWILGRHTPVTSQNLHTPSPKMQIVHHSHRHPCWSQQSACALFPAWGWEGIVRFKTWWRIYLFLHIWCWGIMVKGRIPISSCAGHRQHYCWKSMLSHTPMQTYTVFGNQESPTACSLIKSRILRGSFKRSILSIALKVESRASPCCGAGNVMCSHWMLNTSPTLNAFLKTTSNNKKIHAYLFNLSLQKNNFKLMINLMFFWKVRYQMGPSEAVMCRVLHFTGPVASLIIAIFYAPFKHWTIKYGLPLTVSLY